MGCFDPAVSRILTKNSSILEQQKPQNKKANQTKNHQVASVGEETVDKSVAFESVLHLVALINWKFEACSSAMSSYNGTNKVDVKLSA